MRSASLTPASACAFWLASAIPSAATISFPVTIIDPDNTYLSYHDDLRAAIQGAGAAWAEHLEESENITLEVQVNLGLNISTAAGSSGTSVFVHNDGVRDIWEQGAAAEVRTGIDPNGSEPDIEFDVGANYLTNELWFDPAPLLRTATVPGNKTDAVSVFIHEFGHAFAFNGWINWATGERPATYQSTFDELTTSAIESYRFNGPRSTHLYGDAIPLTTGNIYHLANRAGQPGHDLILDVMNGVVSLRGVRDEVSGYALAIAEDINVPIGVTWDHFSKIPFKQSSAIKTLSPHLDEDGDLASNYSEFVYGTDPFSRDSVSLPAYTFSEDQSGVEATMNFPLIRSVRGISIQPETSVTLNGPFSPQGSPFLPQDANAALQLATFTSGQLNDPKWFARINVASSPAARSNELIQNEKAPQKLITGPKPIRRECLHCLREHR